MANQDIDYIVKDFDSAVDAMINFATVNFGAGTSANRLWTDFNSDSFSRNWLEIVAYMADLFFFYFDVQATQAYLQTSTVRSAVEDIAAQFGFTPATATSSSGTVTFTTSAAGTIPRGFRVRASNGTNYFLTSNVVASAAGNFSGSVLQGIIKNEQFSAVGLQNEEFNVIGPKVIRDLTNANPADISPKVVVNGNEYFLASTFIRNNGTDADPVKDSLGAIIGGGGRIFTLGERANGTPFIRFGDGIFGRKLLPGELVTVTYRTEAGTSGNIGKQTLTALVDNLSFVTSVVNPSAFSGGTDEQSIEQLRELIPASLRTLDRAVAESDYSDILKATFTEVASASTERNTTDLGIDLNIYVVPAGSGITNITDNVPLKNKLTDFIERRKMVTIQFAILDAFGIDVLLGLRVFVEDSASKTTVRTAIDTALSNYFNLSSGGPDGSGMDFSEEILTEDLTNILDTISGIKRFEFTRHTYRPRVAQNIQGLTTTYRNSAVEIFPNVSESEWLLAASGTDSFKCFKKLNGTATNLSIDSITDNELNLSVKTGTASSLSNRVLLDNAQVFIANQYASGDFYLVDSSGNIWDIEENTSNTIKTSITAVNDASISVVASGDYKIVTKLQGKELIFNESIFFIQYNSDKTIFSIGSQFSNIGTIGDKFQISSEQTNVGTLGIAADLINYDSGTQTILLNNSPDLSSVDDTWNLIDNEGQVFNIVSVDDVGLASVFYDNVNQDSSSILEDSGTDVQLAQGFKVLSSNIYSVVSLYLKRSGGVTGFLTAKIVEDDGFGLPDLGNTVAISTPLNISSIAIVDTFSSATEIPSTGFEKTLFTFITPPNLTSGTQYHLVIAGDASYAASQEDGLKTYDNSLSVTYAYNISSGILSYTSSVDLSTVSPGDYFRDGTGTLFLIESVNDDMDEVLLNTGLSINTTINADSGTIYRRNNIFVSVDGSSPTYADGEASTFDGSVWTNFGTTSALPFTVEGPKSIVIDSTLTPSLGSEATISKRYYDDESEISLILGLSNGFVTYASDVNATGKGTVGVVANKKVDTFVFRTSKYVDDITNLRANEIPEYSTTNLSMEIVGGID